MVNKNIIRISMIIISILLLYILCEAGGFFSKADETVFEIHQGMSYNSIVDNLSKDKIINNKFLFKAYSKIMAGEKLSDIKAGKIIIHGKITYSALLDLLCIDARHTETISVTIPEGYNLKEIKLLLDNNNLIDINKFEDILTNYDFEYSFLKNIEKSPVRHEGYLFPDTYYFTENDDELSIINAMLSRFNDIYLKYENEIKASELSLYEIVTLASIIEKEGGNKEEFNLVSSVFHNRLKRKDNLSYLQSCATVQYLLDEKKEILSNKDIAIDSPYNTYKYPGLPKGPIASPGEAAIKAALNPAKTNYLYFQNDSEGILHFTDNYNEHLNNMKKYQ